MLKNIITFFTLLVLIIAVFLFFKFEVQDQKVDYALDMVTLSLESQLKHEQMNALEIALVLSKNQGLLEALRIEDEDEGYRILSDIMLTIKSNTNRYIRAQVITADYHVFARSWDNIYAGMPLEDYRSDLYYFNENKKARTSIEIGRRLGIKATVPVYANEELIGFVEVIDFFESLTSYFRSQGIDLYVLLDDKYFEQVVLMQENLTIKNYIVANRNYNFNNIQTLNRVDFKNLRVTREAHLDGKYLFYETMRDGSGQSIGAFVFVLPQKYLEYFKNPEDDISFLINVTRSSLYDVVKHEEQLSSSYGNFDAQTLLYIKEGIPKEDRELFYEEAYKKLDKLDKDQLIQLMLEHKVVNKIDGKIR
ncbi:MAG: hypothetical protein IE916_04980 [Epsilonproteobacteria bacterium]|nr:hypothetical protein [Campylobacterota bacterium]